MGQENEMNMDRQPITIYARVDEDGFVVQFLDTAHFLDEILDTDIFVEEGFGDDYAYPHARVERALVPFDENGCYNFILENGTIRRITMEEKEAELAKRPDGLVSQEELQAEQNLDFDYRLSMLELGL